MAEQNAVETLTPEQHFAVAGHLLGKAEDLHDSDRHSTQSDRIARFALVHATLALYKPVAGASPAPVPAPKAAPKRGNRVQ